MSKQCDLFKMPDEARTNTYETNENERNEEDEWEKYSDTGSYEDAQASKDIPVEHQVEMHQQKISTRKQPYSTRQKNTYRIKSSELEQIDEQDKMRYGYSKYPKKGNNYEYSDNAEYKDFYDYQQGESNNYDCKYTYDNSSSNYSKYERNTPYSKKYHQYSDNNYDQDYKSHQKYHTETKDWNYDNKQDYHKNNYYDKKYYDNNISYKIKSDGSEDISTMKNANDYYGNKKGGFQKQSYVNHRVHDNQDKFKDTTNTANYSRTKEENTNSSNKQDELRKNDTHTYTSTRLDYQNYHSNRDTRTNDMSKEIQSSTHSDYTNTNPHYAIKRGTQRYDKNCTSFQRNYHSGREEEPDLVKPVFINSKLINKDKEKQGQETEDNFKQKENLQTNTAESTAEKQKSIPMCEIISFPIHQINEKIKSTKSQIVELQKNNTLSIDKPAGDLSVSKLQEQENSKEIKHIEVSQNEAMSLSQPQIQSISSPILTLPSMQNPYPNMMGIMMTNYPNKNLYTMSLNPYAPNLNENMVPLQNINSGMMMRPMNSMMANYYSSNPMIYQQTMSMNNPTLNKPTVSIGGSETPETEELKDFGKLNLNAKEFVPKKKPNVENKFDNPFTNNPDQQRYYL